MFSVRITGQELLKKQLDTFADGFREHQKLALFLAKYVRKQARQNIRQQREISGSSFKPRKPTMMEKRRRTRRMLMGLSRDMTVWAKSGGAIVGWRNGIEPYIAYRQQEGGVEQWSAEKAARVYGSPNYKGEATHAQAKALLREGYRLMVPARGGGRRPKRVTTSWIVNNLSLGQAGAILRLMYAKNNDGERYDSDISRRDAKRSNAKWDVETPPRPFLGVTQQQAEEMTQKLVQKLLRNIRKSTR